MEGLSFLSSPFPPGLMDQVHGSCVGCVCVCVYVCVGTGWSGRTGFPHRLWPPRGKGQLHLAWGWSEGGVSQGKRTSPLPKKEAGSLILLATELGLRVSIYAVRVNLEIDITSLLEFNCFLRCLPTAIATTMLEEGLPKPSPALVPFLIRHFWWLLMSVGKSPVLAGSPRLITPPLSPTSMTSPQALSS